MLANLELHAARRSVDLRTGRSRLLTSHNFLPPVWPHLGELGEQE